MRAVPPRPPKIALGAILTLAAALMVHYGRGELVDDAFISFRYAQNLAAGHGVVFNSGERVEGYTNFLWVVLLSLPAAIGIDIARTSQLIGGACALLTLVVTAFLLPSPGGLSWGRLLAPALLAVNATFPLWAVHGLETALFTLLTTAAVAMELRAYAGGRAAVSSLCWGLATLTRPEGLGMFTASTLYGLTMRRQRWWVERGWLELAIYAAIVAPHFGWRLAYYGYPLPNTFYVKSGLSWALIEHGLIYVGQFFSVMTIPAWLFLAPAAARASDNPGLRYVGWMASAYLAIVILEGGDFFPAFRFMVPVLPLLYVLVQEGTWRALASLPARMPAWAPALVLAGGLLLWLPHLAAMRAAANIESAGSNAFTGGLKLVAAALKEHSPPTTTIAANPIGALAYYSERPTIDMLGLTDAHIAHSPAALGTGIIAHEKGDGAYVFARRPDIVLIGNVLIESAPPATFLGTSWPAWLKSERELVAQPELKTWYERAFLPLADGRYVYFLKRKGLELRRSP